MSKNHSVTKSFSFAISGIGVAIKDEPNIRIHFAIAAIAIIAAYFLAFSRTEWIILFFTISFVFVLELINTALEALIDIVSPHHQERAKTAKDVSAAAVLVSALLSLIVAAFLYLPKILPLLNK